jgi:hypothetical protein
MAKKGDGSNTKLITTVAVTGVVFLLRKLLATAWTKITGKVPPTDVSDPSVSLPEALVWAGATRVAVEATRFAIVRYTMRRSAATDAEAS